MVSGLALLDAVAKSSFTYDGMPPAELESRLANELVSACLDEHRHIDDIDACGPRKKWRRLYVRETEAAMRKLHEEWLAAARPLLKRVRRMKGIGQAIEKLEELEDAVLSTRGWLAMTLDELEAARQQAREGKCYTLEEVRRELRVPVHK